MNFKVLNSKIGFAAEVFGVDATKKTISRTQN